VSNNQTHLKYIFLREEKSLHGRTSIFKVVSDIRRTFWLKILEAFLGTNALKYSIWVYLQLVFPN